MPCMIKLPAEPMCSVIRTNEEVRVANPYPVGFQSEHRDKSASKAMTVDEQGTYQPRPPGAFAHKPSRLLHGPWRLDLGDTVEYRAVKLHDLIQPRDNRLGAFLDIQQLPLTKRSPPPLAHRQRAVAACVGSPR